MPGWPVAWAAAAGGGEPPRPPRGDDDRRGGARRRYRRRAGGDRADRCDASRAASTAVARVGISRRPPWRGATAARMDCLLGGVACVRSVGGSVARAATAGVSTPPRPRWGADDPRGGGAGPDRRRAPHRRAGTRRGARVASPRLGRTMTTAAATATAAVHQHRGGGGDNGGGKGGEQSVPSAARRGGGSGAVSVRGVLVHAVGGCVGGTCGNVDDGCSSRASVGVHGV